MSIYIVAGLALSGKKTLFNGVHAAVSGSAYYNIISVETTKDAAAVVSPYEVSISTQEFQQRKEKQQYLVDWSEKANPKVTYGLPSSFLSTLRPGRKVMLFLPFHIIPAAEKALVPHHNVTVVLLTATNDTLQGRIKALVPPLPGGKETDAQKEEKKRRAKLLQESIEAATSVGVGKIALGLVEKQEKPTPASASSTKPTTPRSGTPSSSTPAAAAAPASLTISSSSANSVTLTPSLSASATDPNFIGFGYTNDAGVEAHSTIYCLPSAPTPNESIAFLLSLFGFDAAAEAKRQNEFDLQTCAPQDYLARTVFPILYPALQQVDAVRPADAVEYLALLLQKESASQQKRVTQLNDIHSIREQLRAQFKKEYSVSGRV